MRHATIKPNARDMQIGINTMIGNGDSRSLQREAGRCEALGLVISSHPLVAAGKKQVLLCVVADGSLRNQA